MDISDIFGLPTIRSRIQALQDLDADRWNELVEARATGQIPPGPVITVQLESCVDGDHQDRVGSRQL